VLDGAMTQLLRKNEFPAAKSSSWEFVNPGIEFPKALKD